MNHNKKQSIIIFYPTQIDILKSHILYDVDYALFDPNNDIKFKYLFMSLFYIPKIFINNFYISKEVNLIKFLKILKLYFFCKAISLDISRKKPKAVLTYIDNSPIFHIVSRECSNIPFIAIQNGNRELFAMTEELIHPSHKYHIDEYFCYGPKTKDLFSQYKQNDIGKYFFCGSLKEGIFFENNYNESISRNKIHDICLISEWTKDENILYKKNSWRDHKKSFQKICLFLHEYIKINNISISIALRSRNKEEENFFKKYFKNNVVFYHVSNDGFSSYNASCLSDVTIALYSALALEMIGAGSKVLYVNPFGSNNYKVSKNKCDWYLHEPNYDQFATRLKLLSNKKRINYVLDNHDDIAYINSFNHNMPMHKILRKSILSKIAEKILNV